MAFTDDLVGSVINAAEDKLHGEEEETKSTVGGAILRFLISTIWFIITLIASLAAFYAMAFGQLVSFLGNKDGNIICIMAIGLCFIIFLLTFLIPYLRKKGSLTRWCGIIALGDALWWIYIMVTN